MGMAAVFIDGGYLDKVLLLNHGGKKIDYQKLVRELVTPNELLRTYYYHCLPYQSNPPTTEESSRYAAMHGFCKALSHIPRFEVRLGKLAYRGNTTTGEKIFVQKRVDCMVGVDMALLAGKGRISNVILVSGDSDFIPAIEAVKREGIIITLWHGKFYTDGAPSRELVEVCDESKEISDQLISMIMR